MYEEKMDQYMVWNEEKQENKRSDRVVLVQRTRSTLISNAHLVAKISNAMNFTQTTVL